MKKLDDILIERGKYSAGVERQDVVLHGLTVEEAKRQIKDIFNELIGNGKYLHEDMFGGQGLVKYPPDVQAFIAELRRKVDEL